MIPRDIFHRFHEVCRARTELSLAYQARRSTGVWPAELPDRVLDLHRQYVAILDSFPELLDDTPAVPAVVLG
jgi:hypothetical protein